MKVTIHEGRLNAVSYVAANMRASDRREIWCQLPPGTESWQLAHQLTMGSSECFTAAIDGQPVAAFGVGPLNPVALSVWCFGTKRCRRAVPEVTRFFVQDFIWRKIEQGYLMMEARSIVDHVEAHRWMESTGAVREGEAYPYGRQGEMFYTYRWTVSGYRAIADKTASKSACAR